MAILRLGGLSGAKVFKAEIFEESQTSIARVVVKVAAVRAIEDEIDRYRRYVAPAVKIGAFAPLAGEVLAGAGRFGAAFYSWAARWEADLFSIVADSPAKAADVVDRLKEVLEGWERPESKSLVRIGDLRSARVFDDQLTTYEVALERLGWREVEAIEVEMNMSVQHGDLHGRNLLVDDEGLPLIIDYGDVGEGPALLDPVTLELSLLLHDEHPDLGGWPDPERARAWFKPTDMSLAPQ